MGCAAYPAADSENNNDGPYGSGNSNLSYPVIAQLHHSPLAARRSVALASNHGTCTWSTNEKNSDTVITEEPRCDKTTAVGLDGDLNEKSVSSRRDEDLQFELRGHSTVSLKSQTGQELIDRLTKAEIQTSVVHQTAGDLTNTVMHLEEKVAHIVNEGGNLKSEKMMGVNCLSGEIAPQYSGLHDGNHDLQQLNITNSVEQEFVSRLTVFENRISAVEEDAERLRAAVQQLKDKVPQVVAANSDLQSKCLESENELVVLQTQLSGMHEKLAANEEKLKSCQEGIHCPTEEQLHIHTDVNASLEIENASLHEQLASLRQRLELQARRQVERSGTSESLCDSRRSSELARRFNSLYNDRVSDLLDQLDLVVKWTEDDLNQFALDLFKECAAVADRYVEKQVLRVLGLFGCNKINRSEVKDSVSGAVSLILGTSKDNKALDISPMKEEVFSFMSTRWAELNSNLVQEHVTPFLDECLDFLLDVKCHTAPFYFEWNAGVQFQADRHNRYYTSSSSGTYVMRYVWPAFIDGSVCGVLCKGMVET